MKNPVQERKKSN